MKTSKAERTNQRANNSEPNNNNDDDNEQHFIFNIGIFFFHVEHCVERRRKQNANIILYLYLNTGLLKATIIAHCTMGKYKWRTLQMWNENKGRPSQASAQGEVFVLVLVCALVLAFMEQNKIRMKNEIELNVESTIAKAFGLRDYKWSTAAAAAV